MDKKSEKKQPLQPMTLGEGGSETDSTITQEQKEWRGKGGELAFPVILPAQMPFLPLLEAHLPSPSKDPCQPE